MNASNDSCLFTVRPRTPAIALDSHRQYVPVQNLYEDMPTTWVAAISGQVQLQHREEDFESPRPSDFHMLRMHFAFSCIDPRCMLLFFW